jgi:hypothetical protein
LFRDTTCRTLLAAFLLPLRFTDLQTKGVLLQFGDWIFCRFEPTFFLLVLAFTCNPPWHLWHEYVHSVALVPPDFLTCLLWKYSTNHKTIIRYWREDIVHEK